MAKAKPKPAPKRKPAARRKPPAGPADAKPVPDPPAPAPAPAAAPFRPQVHVRMYCQGLGDCFLLRFEAEPGKVFHVLIDCGIYKASPKAGELMNRVVDDVVAELAKTTNRLDVLVSTHEHWDHISGFSQALKKFEAMQIGEVWQAWTEDPDNPDAVALRRKYEAAKAKLIGLMRAAPRRPGAAARALDEAFHVMAFFGMGKVEDADEVGAYAAIQKLMAAKNPQYLAPGAVKTLDGTGVRAYVLGPPTTEASLRKRDIAKKDAYEKQHAFFEGMDALLGATGASWADVPAETDMSRPFDRRQEIPVEVARQSEFFQTAYGFAADHPEAFRSIDDLVYESLGSLALRMDNYTNNTSLVLAFRLSTGRVLLFPGDAQGGNWKSWADKDNPLKFDDTDAHRLLADTVFYKVGHHGSHNATPRTFGLDLMRRPDLRAFVPVDHQIAQQARYGAMPLQSILAALHEKPGGAVHRSDDPFAPDHPVFRFADKEIEVTIRDGEPPVRRRLWCETSFDLK